MTGRYLPLMLICILLGSCVSRQAGNNNDNSTEMEKEISYLALGDSYTIGESVDPDLRWPVRLADSLRKDGLPVSDPLIVARTGWTTDELNRGITEAGLLGTYDLVSLLIGVNNQYRGRDSEEFRPEFAALLERAVGFAGNDASRVFVLSIPDWGVMPFAEGRDSEQITAEIDEYNNVCSQECARLKISYFDITAISREASSRPELVAADGLHPSGEMYSEWVELILDDIKDKLVVN